MIQDVGRCCDYSLERMISESSSLLVRLELTSSSVSISVSPSEFSRSAKWFVMDVWTDVQ